MGRVTLFNAALDLELSGSPNHAALVCAADEVVKAAKELTSLMEKLIAAGSKPADDVTADAISERIAEIRERVIAFDEIGKGD
jgi:hypothetical protein